MKKFVFTCGDINGIGTEICLKTFSKIYKKKNKKIIFVSPSNVFLEDYRKLNLKFAFDINKKFDELSKNEDVISVLDIGKPKRTISKPTSTSGKISFKSFEKAFKLVSQNKADAIVTAQSLKMHLN